MHEISDSHMSLEENKYGLKVGIVLAFVLYIMPLFAGTVLFKACPYDINGNGSNAAEAAVQLHKGETTLNAYRRTSRLREILQ